MQNIFNSNAYTSYDKLLALNIFASISVWEITLSKNSLCKIHLTRKLPTYIYTCTYCTMYMQCKYMCLQFWCGFFHPHKLAPKLSSTYMYDYCGKLDTINIVQKGSANSCIFCINPKKCRCRIYKNMHIHVHAATYYKVGTRITVGWVLIARV